MNLTLNQEEANEIVLNALSDIIDFNNPMIVTTINNVDNNLKKVNYELHDMVYLDGKEILRLTPIDILFYERALIRGLKNKGMSISSIKLDLNSNIPSYNLEYEKIKRLKKR